MRTKRLLAGFAVLVTLVALPALAQQPQTVRVRGTIASVDGSALVIKQGEGPDVTVKLTDNAQVFGVVPAKLADVKIGDFIGVGAMPQSDGSQKAIKVMIFAESQRGLGEGFRPWDRPGSTMTNGTVDTTVAGVDGQVLTVKYKDGAQKIIVGPDAVIRAYIASDKSELKPGAHIAIVRADKTPDGTLQTARVNVGRDDVVPQ
jgi:D-arabinose 1-dehydrogenase-like Zn-dependent alcohol dehydrogenase